MANQEPEFLDDAAQPAREGDADVRAEWNRIFADLAARYPGASRGVLFCIHKLEMQPDLRLRDFKDEAALHGVALSGRSYHSARLALGLEQPKAPAPRRPAEAPVARAPSAEDSPMIGALRRLLEDADSRSDDLRLAIREVLRVVDDALSD